MRFRFAVLARAVHTAVRRALCVNNTARTRTPCVMLFYAVLLCVLCSYCSSVRDVRAVVLCAVLCV